MTDFSELLQKGATHAWLFRAYCCPARYLARTRAGTFEDDDGRVHHRDSRHRLAGGIARPLRRLFTLADHLGSRRAGIEVRKPLECRDDRTVFPARLGGDHRSSRTVDVLADA